MLIDVYECTSSPCQHGATCVDDVNGYTCICADGWTGLLCETSKYYSIFFKWLLGHYKRFIKHETVVLLHTNVYTETGIFLLFRYRRMQFIPMSTWCHMCGWCQWIHLYLCWWMDWSTLWNKYVLLYWQLGHYDRNFNYKILILPRPSFKKDHGACLNLYV